jgi:hypothetical protein
MSDPFAGRVLEALYASDLALDAVYAPPGEAFDAEAGAVRVILSSGPGEDPVGLGGYQASPIQARTALEIRAADPGLQAAAPVENGQIRIDAAANIFPGETFVIDGAPLRLDPARLVWTCYVSEAAS